MARYQVKGTEQFRDKSRVGADVRHAMAHALMRLLKDPDLARSLGHAARAKLEAEYAPKVVAARMVRFLESVL